MNFFRGRYSLFVAIGAIFGALSRFYIGELIDSIFGQEWGFLGTFFVNISGCLIIAYILLWLGKYSHNCSRIRIDDCHGFLWFLYNFFHL